MSIFSGRPRRRSGLAVWSLVALTFIGLATLPTGYVIERPGQSFNVMGKVGEKPVISSAELKSYPSDSQIDILTVSLLGNRNFTPNWLQVLGAWVDPEQVVLPLDEVYPPEFTQEQIEAESSLQMEISQQDAIAAALNNLGYQVQGRLYVNSVLADSPASGILIAGDYLDSVNGKSVLVFDELKLEIQKSNGQEITLGIERNDKPLDLKISPVKKDENWVIGAMVGTTYDFPVDIKLQLGDVGGPSGGMMFALGIIDTFTPESLAGDLHIAGTGTITATGSVGSIGGVELKMIAAKRSNADLFIGPFSNCSEISGNIPEGLEVVAVKNLAEAIEAIENKKQGKLSPNLSCER